MSIQETPFLNQAEASELFQRMSEKTKRERRKLARKGLSPRDLLEYLKDRDSA